MGKIYEHIRKESDSGYPHDGKYIVVSECRMKNPVHGEWIDGIIYKSVNDDKELFVREKKDFIKKFKVTDYAN